MNCDDGFNFGLGAFETLAVVQGVPLFLTAHLERLNKALQQLGIDKRVTEEEVWAYAQENPMLNGVIKVAVSEENTIWSHRENYYTKLQYERGFKVGLSKVLRNETSLFTYIKSLNYGDNIIEKRKAPTRGYDEPIFINTKGELAEGATTNLFLVKKGEIITPSLESGLLAGTVRQYLLGQFKISERKILLEEVEDCEEMFLTNALIGVMPVKEMLQGSKVYSFPQRRVGDLLLKHYRQEVQRQIKKGEA